MTAASGFCVFDTAIGPCGLAWGGNGVVGAQLPETSEHATRARLRRQHPQAVEGEAPQAMQSVIATNDFCLH